MLQQDASINIMDTVKPKKANGIYIPETFAFEVIRKTNFIVSYQDV